MKSKTGIVRPGASRVVTGQKGAASGLQPRDHVDPICCEAERARWMCDIFGQLAEVGDPIAPDDFRTMMEILDESLAVIEDESRALRGAIERATGHERSGRHRSAPSPRANGHRHPFSREQLRRLVGLDHSASGSQATTRR